MENDKTKNIQNTTPRIYTEINGFEMREGKFVNPNEYYDGAKYEIRLLHNDPEIMALMAEHLKKVVLV